MEILCCPVCKGDLELRVDVEKDEILEGSLFCKHCNHRYEIKDGIPDLLPPDCGRSPIRRATARIPL